MFEDGEFNVTADDITAAIAATQPPHRDTAIKFCRLIPSVIYSMDSRDLFIDAGVVPVRLTCFVDGPRKKS